MSDFKKDFFSKETILYILYGVGTSAVDFLTFSFLVVLGFGSVASNSVAWVVAVLYAFIVNKIFVFKSKAPSKTGLLREFVLFVGGRAFTLVLSDLILAVAEAMDWNVFAAKIIGMILTVVINYIFSKFIIFKKGNPSDAQNTEA